MDGGAWWAAVHGVAKGRTRLSDFTFTFHFHALEKKMATHSSVLAWRIPGTGEPGGLPSMGSHRVGHDWSDSAAACLSCVLSCLRFASVSWICRFMHAWVLSHFSRVQLCGSLWTVACQGSMGFSRQKYWSTLPWHPPGDHPNPGIKPVSLMSPALGGRFFTTSANWKAPL